MCCRCRCICSRMRTMMAAPGQVHVELVREVVGDSGLFKHALGELLCVLRIRSLPLSDTRVLGAPLLRRLPPDVAVVKTAHARQADDLGGWRWPRLHLPARR
jgi:hypothetical protein